jgi:hypothetical protein
MVDKPRKVKSSQKRKQVVITVCAMPAEIAAWREAAKSEDRNLSSWVRVKLNEFIVKPGAAERPAAQ